MATERRKRGRKPFALPWYKRAFLAGLATLLPTILTLALLVFAWGLLNKYITKPINDGVKWVLMTRPARAYVTYPLWDLERASPPPGASHDDVGAIWVRRVDEGTGSEVVLKYRTWLDRQYPSTLGPKSSYLSAIGLILGVTLIFFAGIFFTSFLGTRLRRWLEAEFYRVPIIKAIYPYAKQVTEFIFKEDRKRQFSQVVAVEYPRKGIYSIGFVTGSGFKSISEAAGGRMLNIFIPSSPTPITGYVIFVPESEAIPIPMTVDETFRFLVSGGVLVPAKEVPPDSSVEFRSGEVAGITGRFPKE